MDLQPRRNSAKAESRDSTVSAASKASFLLPRAEGFSGGAFALTLTLITDSCESLASPEVFDELEGPGRETASENPPLLDRVGAGMTGVKAYSLVAGEATVGVVVGGVAGD